MGINKVTFNAVDFWEDLGAALTSAPEYPIPAETKELVKVKGASGTLTESTGYFNNLEMTLSFRSLKKFRGLDVKEFFDLKRKINLIFNKITDTRLRFSEYPNKYYKVKVAEVGAVTKISEEETDFEINFICDPFLYSIKDTPVTTTGTIQYNGDIPNAPIISFKAVPATYSVGHLGNLNLTFTVESEGLIEIGKNPYSIVTLNGNPLRSSGVEPIFSNGSNTLTITGGNVSELKIIKNERYLG